MKVVDRFGRRWNVRRRWLPWRRKVRDVPDTPDFAGDLGDDPISAIIGLFLLVLAIPAILVVLLLVAELLLLIALLPIVVLVRLILPVPWTIELWARPEERRWLGWHLEHEVRVAGWRASGARITAMAAEIETGDHGGEYVPAGDRIAAERAAADRGEEPAIALPGGTIRGADGKAAPSPFAQRDD